MDSLSPMCENLLKNKKNTFPAYILQHKKEHSKCATSLKLEYTDLAYTSTPCVCILCRSLIVWVLTLISWWPSMTQACHDVFIIMLSYGLSWCSLVCHDMSHTCHYIVTSHDLSRCCHMACHDVVTWPVMMLSHGLSRCLHMTCHDVVTWLVMILSHYL